MVKKLQRVNSDRLFAEIHLGQEGSGHFLSAKCQFKKWKKIPLKINAGVYAWCCLALSLIDSCIPSNTEIAFIKASRIRQSNRPTDWGSSIPVSEYRDLFRLYKSEILPALASLHAGFDLSNSLTTKRLIKVAISLSAQTRKAHWKANASATFNICKHCQNTYQNTTALRSNDCYGYQLQREIFLRFCEKCR